MKEPYISPEKKIPEFTIKALLLGIVLAIIMTAANTYLGLYAGMTVSASIPAAVISMAILRGVLKRGTILENNIVQTIASAGESIAAGIIFTVPALVIVKVWNNFDFITTMLIALSGGLLGIIFMIPIRKVLIVENKDEDLKYPEGIACAEVLKAGEKGGSEFTSIIYGFLLGGFFKLLGSGFGIIKSKLEVAAIFNNRAFFFGTDISPALIGVGYIIKLEVAFLVFLGGVIAWLIGIPLIGIPADLSYHSAIEAAELIWKQKIRYIGVGAMVVGGVWSITSIREGIVYSFKSLVNIRKKDNLTELSNEKRTDKNITARIMVIVLVFSFLAVMLLYSRVTQNYGFSFLMALVMLIASFFFVAVSSYIVGLVGSSNNPVSGMTISTVLAVAILLLILGWHGNPAIFATLGIAGVVCCAACSAGDVSQDLKTGHLLGATPKLQQYGQIIGVVVAALVITPILELLHNAYVIGEGLQAPQATLFAGMTETLFGNGSLPKDMILIGMGIAVILIIINELLKKTKISFRTHVMPVAVGIYLPLLITVPMIIGGLIRYFAEKNNNADSGESDRGILISSGLVAGEAIMGVLLAILILINLDIRLTVSGIIANTGAFLGLIIIIIIIYKFAKQKNSV